MTFSLLVAFAVFFSFLTFRCFFFFSSFPHGLLPLTQAPPPLVAAGGALGGGGLLQRRQQTLLRQVGLQRVEDVELLVHPERQQLLDDLGGVGTPEEGEKEWRPSTIQVIRGSTTRTHQVNQQGEETTPPFP